jgi:hypothetical protein
MKLIRAKKGENNFSITGLTLGKAMAIQNALQACKDAQCLTPVGGDILDFLYNEKLDTIVDFGDSHLKK